jgi:hypothetical protein
MDLTKWDPVVAQELVEAMMAKSKSLESRIELLEAENSRLEEELATALAAWRAEVIRNASKQA